MNLANYKISSGLVWESDGWMFPTRAWLGPGESLIVANSGTAFRNRYGFRPDFELIGNTGARYMNPVGSYSMRDFHNGCILSNPLSPLPHTNTSITDGLSWGG